MFIISKVFIIEGRTYDLSKLHTRKLLKLRRLRYNSTCSCCGMYNIDTAPELFNEFNEALNKELATRENIMNKLESKSNSKLKKSLGKKKEVYFNRR